MRVASASKAGLPRPAKPSASVLLGPEHPLVRVLDALAAVARQSLVAAGVLAASLIAAVAHAAWALPLAAGASLVLLGLVVVGGLLCQRRRELVVALVAAGGEHLPLAAVGRERRRLLDRKMRSSLAASLEGLVSDAANPRVTAGPPLFDCLVVRTVAAELLGVAMLLRAEPSSARGVALVWCLICQGATSPLYGADVAELREDLGRIRYILLTGSVGGQPNG